MASCSLTLLIVGTAASPAVGAPEPGSGAAPTTATDSGAAPASRPQTDTVDPDRRDDLLGKGWRSSKDVAWTTFGDAEGFHVLAADASAGYTWRTVTSLAEPGFDADQWIGNACLTGSGRRLVVVYAPRTFTNDADLFDRGGFTAVVDLGTGAVRKLPVQSSLAYFNPGCGVGETAVVTQFGGKLVDDPSATRVESRIRTVDAAAGTVSAPVKLATEVTSAVPVGDAIIAAANGALVDVARDGTTRRIAEASGVPFRLVPDGTDGLVFLDLAQQRVRVKRTTPGAGAGVRTLAEGAEGELSVARGAAGRVFLTGQPAQVSTLPAGIRAVEAPEHSEISTLGQLALTRVAGPGSGDPRAATRTPGVPEHVQINAKTLGSGGDLAFEVHPAATGTAASSGRAIHPKLGTSSGKESRSGAQAATAGSPTDPVESERYCSVPRNDPRNQVLQPKPRQVEWAVNQAITNSLHVTREANWKNLGMPAYTPQGLFPRRDLLGGGRVPAQIMLGIIAQESNMWQASRYALPGVTGNPLIGNFYGRNVYNETPDDDWDIVWEESDCGYGVAQVTDRMRLAGREKPGETALPYQTQRAVALDFATNVAAGLQILQDKWNQTRSVGMIVNNGNPAYMENWFFAVWAYNSGFYHDKGDGSPWGVGWLNNPINPRYDPVRKPFLEETYADARTPQKWPYPEKIMGWAGHPVEISESPTTLVAGYRAAWWSTVASRAAVKPPRAQFCDATNHCDPTGRYQPNDPDVIGEPTGPCAHRNAAGYYDLRCWYNKPVAWKGGPGLACDCGNEVLRFDPGYAYQEDGTSFPPRCDLSGLPSGSRIIDNLPDGVPTVRSGCGRPWSNAGSFGLRFGSNYFGEYPSKVDFHQLGGGFGGHFYMGYTRKAGNLNDQMKITGTWTINPTNAWTRVLVHIPDHAAYTRQADYKVYLPGQTTSTRHRSVPTRWQEHKWLDLGVFDFRGSGSPKVELSTIAQDGNGTHKIVWDAIAVQPLSAKPRHFVVGMGDSFSSGEGAGDYTRVSDQYGDEPGFKNSCRRNAHGWARQVVLAGAPGGRSLGSLSDGLDANVDFHHIACAGAQTHHVMATRTASGQPAPANAMGQVPRDTSNGELTQIDQGFLDENTTLVMLTIGGNDAGWTDVFKECAVKNCMEPGFTLPGDSQPMTVAVPARFRDKIKLDVRRVINEIRERAPNAWIVLAGYPQIFKSGTTYDLNPLPGVAIGITAEEVDWLNDMARVATTELLYTDLANKINGVDVRADFAGHELGTADATENWLNGYILGDWFRPDDDDGEPNDSYFGAGSFHPNVNGFRAYGGAVSDRLSALGYRWS
ncbi:SGNH/GDSL hydrolase family protein [Micromonospora sp. NPDC049891]|uniref:SGNH/GDSL hydrolase family protein n=1 Tax=Micromonospora sp. NPDC049891 TaxID=3155655 RepID=UPI0033D22FA2